MWATWDGGRPGTGVRGASKLGKKLLPREGQEEEELAGKVADRLLKAWRKSREVELGKKLLP